MILHMGHHLVRTWVDKNLDTYASSIRHREYLDNTPVLTPTGKIKTKSRVFSLKLLLGTNPEPDKYWDILDWLHEQEFQGQWCINMQYNTFLVVAFASTKDAAQFKLVWDSLIDTEYTQ